MRPDPAAAAEGTAAAAPPAPDEDDDLSIDSRDLDRQSYLEYLKLQGIDAGPDALVGDGYVDPIDPRVRARAQVRAAALLKERTEVLSRGTIDAATAEPGAVAARMRQLGVHDPGLFMAARKPQPAAPPTASQRETARRSALEEARKRVLHKLAVADANRLALDTRTLDPLEFEALTRLRGYDRLAPGTTAASGTGQGHGYGA